jgi:hypothetical protein
VSSQSSRVRTIAKELYWAIVAGVYYYDQIKRELRVSAEGCGSITTNATLTPKAIWKAARPQSSYTLNILRVLISGRDSIETDLIL